MTTMTDKPLHIDLWRQLRRMYPDAKPAELHRFIAAMREQAREERRQARATR
jgi:hypothetical protein